MGALSEFINDWLRSWTGNKPEELLSYYAEHVFYSDPANPDGIRGKEDLGLYLSKLLSRNPDWVWKAEEVILTAKGCTLKWKATIAVGKKSIVLFGLDILEIAEGKITRNEVYFDRVPWLRAMEK